MKTTLLAILLAGFSLVSLQGQQFDNPTTIPVTFYGEGVTTGSGTAEFSFGTSLGVPSPAAWAQANAPADTHFYSTPVQTANLVPGVDYNVTVTSSNCSLVYAHFQVQNAVMYLGPSVGQVAVRDSITLGSNFTFVLRVELINDLTSGLASKRGGECSSFPEDKPIWYVGLGSLRNGRFAGAVGFRRSSITSDLFTTAALVYDPIDPSEVSVTRDGQGHISQVQSGAVLLKMTTINSTKYKIDCCLPETPSTAFITYTVSQYTGSGGGIRIDKLEDGVTWSTVLQSSSTSPQWKLYDWRVATAGANIDTTNPITTSISGSVSTVTYGSGTGTNVRIKQKTYAGGELSTLKWGPSETNPPTTSYTYYLSETGTGWPGRVNTTIEPTGTWTKYDYYNGSGLTYAGEISTIYRPWQNSPATPSQADASHGVVETYTYTDNWDDTDVLPASRTVRINNVWAGTTTWDYDWTVAAANGHALGKTTRKEYYASGGSSYLATVSLDFRENDTDTFFRGRSHSVTRPDGTKDSYAYYRGAWDVSNNLFTANSTGGARRILVFHGNAAPGGGASSVSSWSSWTLDPVYMVPNLSTISETVIDVHGRVVRNTEYVLVTSSTAEIISQITHIFNAGGLLQKDKDYVRSITNDEIATSYGYTAGLQTSQTDIDGTATQWHYDNWLRNDTITTAATSTDSNYPGKVQTLTYYSSGLKHTAQECSCSPVSSTYTYDTSGRQTKVQEPKPATGGSVSGTLDTTFTYDSSQKTTTTLPNGATKITEFFLDGRLLSQTGTGQVPTYYAYAVEAGTGNIVKTTSHDASGQAHGWLEETTDWLGRPVKQRTPQVGWSSGNLAVKKTFNYNATTGQLSYYTTVDDSNQTTLLPAHYYTYGNLGLLASEGDDIDGGGLTNAANSRDRITSYLYGYSKVSGSWSFTKTTQVLATFSSTGATTPTTISSVKTRLTAFSNAGLPSGSVAIGETTTTDASGRKAVALDYVIPASRTRGQSTTLDGATQKGLTLWQDGYLKSEQAIFGVIKTYSYQDDGLLAGIEEGTGANASSLGYLYYTGTKFQWKAFQSTDSGSSVASTEYTYTWNTSNKTNTVKATFNGQDTYTEFNALGLPIHVWGTGTQPALYAYDAFGRKTGQTTWQSGTFTGSTWPASPPTGNAIIFTIDSATGALTSKAYPGGSHVDFGYNARGQLKTRTWARLPTLVTTYKYYGDTGVAGDATGELQMIDYPAGTTDITYTYTRVGAFNQVTDDAGTRTIAYNADLTPDTETLGTFYGSKVLKNTYATFGRPGGWQFKNGTTVLASATTGYDTATSRPNSVAGALGTTYSIAFSLAYDTDSRADWVKTVTSTTSGTTFKRDTPLRAGYDVLASAKTTWNTTSTLGDFTAGYETSTGRRSTQSFATSSYGTQLGLAAKSSTFTYDSYGRLTDSASTHTGSTVHWTYDLAGNRATESDDTGFAATSYTRNALDEYSAITGGRAEPGIAYDADGNLTQDGVWTYSFDAENRLTQMTKSGQTLAFKYDYLGRRIRKTVTGTGAKDTKFLWSGWNLVAEVSAADGFTVQKTFVWGPDFSNAQGNAGGAGSLLAQIDATTGISYAITDTFGTAVGYFTGSGTSSTLKLAAEYTAYGKGISSYTAAGVSFSDYPIGYHGHYMDWESGLAYYGLRYYQAKHGRFINRDPIEEAGGNNLYAFVGNNPASGWDLRGLDGAGEKPWIPPRITTDTPKWKDPDWGNYISSLGWTEYTLDFWGSMFKQYPTWIGSGSFTPPRLPPIALRRKAPNNAELKKRCGEIRSQMLEAASHSTQLVDRIFSLDGYRNNLIGSFDRSPNRLSDAFRASGRDTVDLVVSLLPGDVGTAIGSGKFVLNDAPTGLYQGTANLVTGNRGGAVSNYAETALGFTTTVVAIGGYTALGASSFTIGAVAAGGVYAIKSVENFTPYFAEQSQRSDILTGINNDIAATRDQRNFWEGVESRLGKAWAAAGCDKL